jgi:hypothetical protein
LEEFRASQDLFLFFTRTTHLASNPDTWDSNTQLRNLSTHNPSISGFSPPHNINIPNQGNPASTSKMPRKLSNMYSPYGPRPRHSSRLVILWVGCFFLIVFLTWYLNTRHKDTAAEYASKIVGMKPGVKPEFGLKGDWRRGEVLDD